MTLLLLTYFFPPCGAVAAYRALGFAHHLPKSGWNVVVVAPPGVAGEPHDPGLLKKVPATTKVIRVPFSQSILTRALRRWLLYEVWLPSAWRVIKKVLEINSLSVVLTTGPPPAVHLLGWLVKRKCGLPWFACFRDPLISQQCYRPSIINWIQTRVEALTLREADRIIVNTPNSLADLRASYPQYAEKMTMLTNGLDPLPQPPRGQLTLPIHRSLNLLFAGEIYRDRDPRNLLEALKELGERRPGRDPPFRMTFLGRDTEGLLEAALVANPALGQFLTIKGHVPFEEARQAMLAADILCVLQGPGYQPYIPAKIYEYLVVGKPIFALAERGSDVEWVLRTSGVTHQIAESNNRAKIMDALMELSREITEGRARPPDADKIKVFTRESLARELARHLDAYCKF